LNRSEAITFLKELMSQCNNLSPESVSLETPNDSNSIVYRIHIKGIICESDKQSVRDVAQKYNLSVQEAPDGVSIYKPKVQI
jgi:hypothetical protein